VRISLNISKNFGQLNIFSKLEISFDIGKIYSIVGQTGCGKTTLLNIISGIEKPTTGEVRISAKSNLGYLLQENIMLPWRTLQENISLSLEVQQKINNPKTTTIPEYIIRFGLSGFEEYYPDSLSGGMKQRAGLIRCLITEPDVLLLDEPFSNLDFDIKLKIQKEILAYQKRTNATIIMVTHDIEDAIALSDEVIVLTGKPASVKNKMNIGLDLVDKDPVLARKSEKFPSYFAKIWDELKYLNN
jgi:NitT/TauT family transport system ATP-binding protein